MALGFTAVSSPWAGTSSILGVSVPQRGPRKPAWAGAGGAGRPAGTCGFQAAGRGTDV